MEVAETLTTILVIAIVGAISILIIAIAIIYISLRFEQSGCPHNHKFTHVQKSYATCEDIVVTCLQCNKVLEKKTDCR